MPDALPADRLLCDDETAERLQVPPRTLKKWRRQGRGPDFIQLGPRSYRYEPSAIDEFIAAQRRTPRTGPTRSRRRTR
jgi:predicted DNA-binding transcriptional regulator AlpA